MKGGDRLLKSNIGLSDYIRDAIQEKLETDNKKQTIKWRE